MVPGYKVELSSTKREDAVIRLLTSGEAVVVAIAVVVAVVAVILWRSGS
jgi:hypothetical protein